jgi:crotonobetainyl-CoA:carnitine CoA-transferase CaiB-like acyl-CoA transferase
MRTKSGEAITVPNGPVDFGAAEDRVLGEPPGPGEHTQAVLESIGIGVEERDRLIASAVVGGAHEPGVEVGG